MCMWHEWKILLKQFGFKMTWYVTMTVLLEVIIGHLENLLLWLDIVQSRRERRVRRWLQ